jgi:hypothetical protein
MAAETEAAAGAERRRAMPQGQRDETEASATMVAAVERGEGRGGEGRGAAESGQREGTEEDNGAVPRCALFRPLRRKIREAQVGPKYLTSVARTHLELFFPRLSSI